MGDRHGGESQRRRGGGGTKGGDEGGGGAKGGDEGGGGTEEGGDEDVDICGDTESTSSEDDDDSLESSSSEDGDDDDDDDDDMPELDDLYYDTIPEGQRAPSFSVVRGHSSSSRTSTWRTNSGGVMGPPRHPGARPSGKDPPTDRGSVG
ncbi:uncharacterized protein LOC131856559 [Cryptomeria japonica]|uniref:uncharacterized protein LOC131856559 n=1 Tax=Cryptomeria japonica TaxID=3369 RepID=UPI0027DA8526|nr:uncharacterized protein LOC131856559 [Cryptomeria japonica]